jgi:phage baseplate assembly protein gpV
MESIVGVIKKVAEKEAQKIYTTELGVVTSVFPHASDSDKDNYQCSVILKNKKQPDGSDFELRKAPVATPHIGLANIPNVGDLVVVSFIGGNINAPVIIGRLYNDEDQPPVNKEKEILLQHNLEKGGSLKIDSEGILTISSQEEKSVITVKDESITIAGEKSTISMEGGTITIDNDKCKMSVEDSGVTIDAANNNVTVEGSTITIDNGKCKISVEDSGVTIDAGSNNVTVKSMGSIKIGDGATSAVELGGRAPGNAVADNDDIILSMHTHIGNLGAPCPIMVPMEKINSIQAKARNTKVG